MTDQQPPVPPAAPGENPQYQIAPGSQPSPSGPPKPGGILAILAIVFAGLGFILAVLPPTAWIAWIFIVPAIILAIIALAKKSRPRGLPIAAIIVAPVSWIIAIVVALAGFAGGVSDAVRHAASDLPSAMSSADSSGAASGTDASGQKLSDVAVGQTVTNDDGIAFTVTSVACGIPSAGESFSKEDAKGQFCEVKFHIKNGSNKSLNVSDYDIKGLIGTAEYDPTSGVSVFGGGPISADVNPGLEVDATVYIDIPKDVKLDYVQYNPLWSFFTTPVKVKVP